MILRLGDFGRDFERVVIDERMFENVVADLNFYKIHNSSLLQREKQSVVVHYCWPQW